jgi:DNA adenine methylase
MLINQWIDKDQIFIEPFVGAAWIVRGIRAKFRFCSDTNPYLIAMYQALQNGWLPPTVFSADEYKHMKDKIDEADPALVGFIGHFCSFGGKWLGGYARRHKTYGRAEDYVRSSQQSCLKLVPKIKNVEFRCMPYEDYKPWNAFIYCDPPYGGTTNGYYTKKFDTDKFWEKMREWSEHNTVIVSEYEAPSDFKCVAEYPIRMKLRTKDSNSDFRTEKIFSLNEKYDPFQGIF